MDRNRTIGNSSNHADYLYIPIYDLHEYEFISMISSDFDWGSKVPFYEFLNGHSLSGSINAIISCSVIGRYSPLYYSFL